MRTLTVQESLWTELENAARKRHLSAQKLADVALREYLERAADEELLRCSQSAAKRASFPIERSEQLVRQHRSRKISGSASP